MTNQVNHLSSSKPSTFLQCETIKEHSIISLIPKTSIALKDATHFKKFKENQNEDSTHKISIKKKITKKRIKIKSKSEHVFRSSRASVASSKPEKCDAMRFSRQNKNFLLFYEIVSTLTEKLGDSSFLKFFFEILNESFQEGSSISFTLVFLLK